MLLRRLEMSFKKKSHSPEEKKRLNEDFEKFCKAWEKMRPLVCKQFEDGSTIYQ